MLSRRILAAAVTVAALVIPFAATGASAADRTPEPTAVAHIDSAAVAQSIADHDGVLTTSEAARLGLQPDTVYLDTQQARDLHAALVAAAGSKLSTMQPANASGCSTEVCIEVIGKGLTVSNWNTFGYTTGNMCSYAAFWEGGIVAFTGAVVCGDGVLETLTAGYDEPFDNGEVLCNTWLLIGGKPCETIHS